MGNENEKAEKAAETITLTKEQFNQIIKSNSDLAEKVETLEKVAKSGKGIQTTAQRYSEIAAGSQAEVPLKVQQEKISVVNEPATKNGEMLKDKCPYCIKFHKGKQTILDLTTGGKWACRRCGKHWFNWAIFPEDGSEGPHVYNILLERGEQEKFEKFLELEQAKQKVA